MSGLHTQHPQRASKFRTTLLSFALKKISLKQKSRWERVVHWRWPSPITLLLLFGHTHSIWRAGSVPHHGLIESQKKNHLSPLIGKETGASSIHQFRASESILVPNFRRSESPQLELDQAIYGATNWGMWGIQRVAFEGVRRAVGQGQTTTWPRKKAKINNLPENLGILK